ncbi:MAG: hypothetical protein GTO51_09810 [Candidatus Latescibacteria bacterium]|nr:hypothetical protein [Candidatus Latescibacterota bacterium]NIM22224.1 hypothetical protein [Candidatus Latescibacterota bacterium]NIM66263.1 hypothetical protein [Candidatus Latescibacterota bacterium]NIO02340.1 hypothetical protein [Candidatus Latescibacterota bacterium]NIO29871.1 hypothetical protein [Candidatus Latescibacterota bacterium]
MGTVHVSIYEKIACLKKALVFLTPVVLMAPAVVAAPPETELLRSDADRVSFEVRVEGYGLSPSVALEGTERLVIPGYVTQSKPGEPALPSRRFLVAIPPEVDFTVRWSVLGAAPLGRHRLEPAPTPITIRDDAGELFISERFEIIEPAYTDYERKPLLTHEPVAHLRHQRVLPVWIHPVSYDPQTGETSIATHIRVDISFSLPPGRRGGALLDEDARPVIESPAWERILSRVLINPEHAAKWRVKRRLSAKMDQPGLAPSKPVISGPIVKLKVRETGIHKVSAASVIAAGFPPGEPTANLHLFKRQYDKNLLQEAIVDIPFTVSEDPGGTDGVFDGLDYVMFYGLRIRDDSLQEDPVEKFSDYNCYWLGTSGGPTMAQQALRKGFVSADTATASFERVDRYEEDNWFIEYTPPDQEGFYEAPTRIDVYGFNDYVVPSLSLPFDVHAMKPGTTLQIDTEILGGPNGTPDREVDLEIQNSLGNVFLNSVLVPEINHRAYRVQNTSQPAPSTAVVEGENRLVITESQDRGYLHAYLMWFEVIYQSLYRAKGNSLSFHTASLSGDTTIAVTGLTRRDLLLFDVTDPYQPVQGIVADSLFLDVGDGYVFSFRDAISFRKRYVLAPLDAIPEVSANDIAPGAPNTLIGHPLENGVDVLAVSHAGFMDEMQPWVDYRKAQGYKVLMADVNDIYDEFNNGVPNPRAVKNFVRHFFEWGNASFVVLVGDASEDNKNVHAPESPPNFVPTESFPEHVGAPFHTNEVVTSDKWYVLMDNDYLPGQTDFLPDLIIGRLPSGSGAELQVMLNKIFDCEQPQASDFWRRRMIMVADDAWSYTSLGPSNHCFDPGETGFELGEEGSALIIESSPAGGFDVVRFYLSAFLEHLYPTPPQCMNSTVAIDATRLQATPQFISELNKGATLVSIQAHSNRYQICHEVLFTSYIAPAGGSRDHLKLDNLDRPFVVFGMGCHLSDFALHKELSDVNKSFNGPTGDCINELLLFTRARRGAVSTYGSSGFEYLSPNRIFTNLIHETFFTTPPQDTMVSTNRAQVRWIFGEVMTLAEIRYASPGPIKRYHLLGDPLLRIDAGPPRFDVTVNGEPAQSGDLVYGAAGTDTIHVEAIVSDEVAIEKLELEIDGEDATNSMTKTPLIDETLSASRKYKAQFSHRLIPRSYDIILRASQARDTTGLDYSMVGEFLLRVQSDVALRVNGRTVSSGDPVPPKADYLLEIGFPIEIDPSSIEVEIDSVPVPGLQFSHPSPQDTTTWLVSFRQDLSLGQHLLQVFVDGSEMAEFVVFVSTTIGLREVINYPNPFTRDTYFVYRNEVEIAEGRIDIFTTSGKKVARLHIPPNARLPGQNAVHWDGRDAAGDDIANGVYLYVVTVVQRGKSSTIRGKMARIE